MNYFRTALTKCYFCQENSDIIINKLLTPLMASTVEQMHGKIINMNPCTKCEEYMKQGIILITIDESKSGPDWNKAPIPNPWRTGGWFVVTADYINRVFEEPLSSHVIKCRFAFISHEAAEMLGLFGAPSHTVTE